MSNSYSNLFEEKTSFISRLDKDVRSVAHFPRRFLSLSFLDLTCSFLVNGETKVNFVENKSWVTKLRGIVS